jgi:hypothetical protein
LPDEALRRGCRPLAVRAISEPMTDVQPSSETISKRMRID